jgi:hypothetical protein
MTEQPKRRWFRFRLSTVLILTAIAAWGMACRPWYPWMRPTVVIANEVGWEVCEPPPQLQPWQSPQYWAVRRINRQLLWPALALAAFLFWKAAWVVVERRRRRATTSE